MSTIITNLKELEGYKELKEGDVVIFTINEQIIRYTVNDQFLCIYEKDNDEIFRILDIDKNKIAGKAYEYKASYRLDSHSDVNWPEPKENDFSALTRLVKELYLIIKEREIKYTKYNRFEIMDI